MCMSSCFCIRSLAYPLSARVCVCVCCVCVLCVCVCVVCVCVHARERVFEPLYYQLFHWALPDMALGTFVVLTVLLLFHME